MRWFYVSSDSYIRQIARSMLGGIGTVLWTRPSFDNKFGDSRYHVCKGMTWFSALIDCWRYLQKVRGSGGCTRAVSILLGYAKPSMWISQPAKPGQVTWHAADMRSEHGTRPRIGKYSYRQNIALLINLNKYAFNHNWLTAEISEFLSNGTRESISLVTGLGRIASTWIICAVITLSNVFSIKIRGHPTPVTRY